VHHSWSTLASTLPAECPYWPAYRLGDAAFERAGRSDARNYAVKASQEQQDADKLKQQQQQQ
jgi:hypothetical protein